MKNIDQIAAEAAKKIASWIQSDSEPWLPEEIEKATDIIKSAIEKAYDAGWKAACREAVAPKAARATAGESDKVIADRLAKEMDEKGIAYPSKAREYLLKAIRAARTTGK